jgi:hypothetical protein
MLKRKLVTAGCRMMLVRDLRDESERQYKSRRRDNRIGSSKPQWIKSGKPYLMGSPRVCNYL